MADQFDPLASLDQTQDILSRAGFGSDKRKRREAIEMGKSSPSSFTSDFASQIKEAQQPQEWAGAGRQLAKNQQVDPGIADLFKGSLHKTGNELFYYGPDDYSTAQLGTNGYTTKDIGGGKYDILDNSGTSIGTHYGSLKDAIKGYAASDWYSKNPINIGESNNWGATTYTYGDQEFTQYLTEAEKAANLKAAQEKQRLAFENYYNQYSNNMSPQQAWELLGQGLTGQDINLENVTNRRSLGGSHQTENISGLNTLYGSTPLIWNNKLMGYQFDNPVIGSHTYEDRNGGTQSGAYLWREMNDPNTWRNLVQGFGDNKYFVSPENAAKLPGWQNKYSSWFAEEDDGGLFGGVFDFLDPILDKIDPLHDKTQDLIAGGIGADSQKEAFLKVAGPLLTIFGGPWGAAANAANSLSNDDVLGAALSMAGADFGGGSLIGNTVGAIPGLSTAGAGLSSATGGTISAATAQKLINSGLVGAVRAGLSGGNPLTAGSIAGLASLFGSGLGNMTDSSKLGKLGQSAASFGLNTLFNKRGQTSGEEVIRALPTILQASGNMQPGNKTEDAPLIKQITPQERYRRDFIQGKS